RRATRTSPASTTERDATRGGLDPVAGLGRRLRRRRLPRARGPGDVAGHHHLAREAAGSLFARRTRQADARGRRAADEVEGDGTLAPAAVAPRRREQGGARPCTPRCRLPLAPCEARAAGAAEGRRAGDAAHVPGAPDDAQVGARVPADAPERQPG